MQKNMPIKMKDGGLMWYLQMKANSMSLILMVSNMCGVSHEALLKRSLQLTVKHGGGYVIV